MTAPTTHSSSTTPDAPPSDCAPHRARAAARSWGSGVLIAPGWVLTCAHVLAASDGRRRDTGPDGVFGVVFGGRVVPARLAYDLSRPDPDAGPAAARADLALVRLLDPETDHPCAWLSDQPATLLEDAYIFRGHEQAAGARARAGARKGARMRTAPGGAAGRWCGRGRGRGPAGNASYVTHATQATRVEQVTQAAQEATRRTPRPRGGEGRGAPEADGGPGRSGSDGEQGLHGPDGGRGVRESRDGRGVHGAPAAPRAPSPPSTPSSRSASGPATPGDSSSAAMSGSCPAPRAGR